MRLTLRTLLAYLDKTLSPSELNVLDEKIKQAKVANALVERIGTAVTDTSLPPMRIDAQGTAGDANTVAEYLDNTLDPNIVVDFEQAVLSDNTRLAEVAACHQILSSLLADPESVSMTTKQALKDAIRARIESKTNTSGVDEIVSTTLLAGTDRAIESTGFVSKSFQEKTVRGIDLSDASEGHVPDYLKSNHHSGWGSLISTASLVAAVLGLAWVSLGSFESVQELFVPPEKLAKLDTEKAAEINIVEETSKVDEVVKNSANEGLPSSVPANQEVASIPVANVDGGSTVTAASGETPSPSIEAPLDVTADLAGGRVAGVAEEPITGEALNSVAMADGTPITENSVTEVPKESRSEPELIWRPETKAASEATMFLLKAVEEGQARLELVAAGDKQLIGDRWLTVTGSRTDCWIEPGIRWKIADCTDLSVDKVFVNEAAVVQLRLGRALVASTPNCQILNLETMDGKIRQIHFNDPNGIVAVEVRHQTIPGASVGEYIDSDKNLIGMMNTVVTLMGVVGEATVSEDSITVERLGVGETITWIGIDPLVRGALKSMPWWFKNSAPLHADIATASDFQQVLVDWKTSNEEILKIAPNQKAPQKGPQKSQVALLSFLESVSAKRTSPAYVPAIQLLLLCGNYTHLFGTAGVLADPSVKSHRASLIDTFEQSLGADPGRELSLKEQLEAIDPARASRLLQLVSTPSDDQLERGVDRILVDAISSPYLDERVLGIHQLVRITGRDLGYQADRPTPDSVQAWKKLLNANKIRWPKPKS
ncbi:MAG: hypothetical protein NTW52_10380 [Planctomycetota bacterium]|nr:hypothetical protein [Planctomycetota bacterium]